jgi:hypothetical protein
MKKANGQVSAVTWNAAHEVNEDMEGVDTCFWQQRQKSGADTKETITLYYILV